MVIDLLMVLLTFYMEYHTLLFLSLRVNQEIISGLIFDPIKMMFYAEKNNGAYLNNKRIGL